MDHAEARELLELAAVEPGGLERLMAGDTADAAALAGHLAGCESCADELARLRAASMIIRDVVRTTPPPELREHTLAFVRELGRDRRGGPVAVAAGGGATTMAPDVARAGRIGSAQLRPLRLGWVAAVAAALIVAVVVTAVFVQLRNDEALRTQAAIVNGLSRVTVWYLSIEGEADARRIDLASTSGGPAHGTVELSVHKQQLVVVATDLAAPPGDQQLACWLEINGQRHAIGRMFFGGGLAYWAGDVELPATIPAGSRFGVSTPGGEPILVGEL
jgi:hypothetical protein